MRVRVVTVLLCLQLGCALRAFLSPRRTASRRLYDVAPSSAILTDERESLRKWYTLQFQKRAEVVVSDAATVSSAVTELWKAILVSVRILEKDQMLGEHVSLVALTQYAVDASSAAVELERFQGIAASINADQSSLLFQPNFKRTVSAILKPPLGDGVPACIVVLVDTKRIAPELVEFDDIDDFVPPVEDALTNNIESFPFPTVFDFISEVNRPPDPLTLSQLTFDYKVTDFKYDLTKMAKKKNPQEVLKSINCKLTRLQKWREVLSQPSSGDIPDPFVEAAEWGDAVKRKYQSLKAMVKADTKNALDTQYDKRATFIKIIDQWSERLKRSFKFTYFASKRAPEDFQKAIFDSKWRNEVLNTTRLLSQTPFLDFGGPDFRPGAPEPIFRDDRYIMYPSGYDVELVLYEMLAWFKSISRAQSLALAPAFADSIVQHTYSRGLITERVMFDVWQGLNQWLRREGNGHQRKPKQLCASELAEQLSLRKGAEELDHTDTFLSSMRQINSLARESSIEKRASVKEMFKAMYGDGKELTEWWTTLVRDLDLTDAIETAANERSVPWSEIVDKVITEENLKEGRGTEGGLDAVAAAKAAEENTDLWKSKYQQVLLFSEQIDASLPWKQQKPETPSLDALATFAQQVFLKDETVTLDFKVKESSESTDPSFLYIAPRFFRGIGMDQELVRTIFRRFDSLHSTSTHRLTIAHPPTHTPTHPVPIERLFGVCQNCRSSNEKSTPRRRLDRSGEAPPRRPADASPHGQPRWPA